MVNKERTRRKVMVNPLGRPWETIARELMLGGDLLCSN